ncbi:pectin lyase-like protein [Dichomitus squalens]|nr:pectin lyase-like protein [Dichomitus squalens]
MGARIALLLLLPLIPGALTLRKPPPGAITIGKGGQYVNLSSALQDTSSLEYFVFEGTYTDTAVITRDHVRIYGQTNIPDSYLGNTVTITNNIPASQAGSNDKSGTVQVHAANVSLYNLNIANTYGKPVVQAQAIALSVQGGQFGGYGLKISGDQDTLLANVGTQYYANSLIEGAVDFIFGQHASIWITHSVIHTIADGNITASGRSSDDAFWYVIDHSTILGNGTQTYLGRPWGAFARVVYQHSWLPKSVPAVGWAEWHPDDERISNVTFVEYANIGPGAAKPGQRANFSTQLTSPISIHTVLNTTSWIDPAFLHRDSPFP